MTNPSEEVMFTTGDIDGDQDDDLVVFIDRANGVANRAEYIVMRNSGSGFVQEPRVSGGPATGLEDIDGDGDLDGVCCGGSGSLPARNGGASMFHLSINDGTGRFANAWEVQSLGAFRFAGCDDVDGDGDKDLVAGRSIFFNQSGFEVAPQPPGDLSLSRCAHDADGDGDLDFGFGFGTRRENDGTGSTETVDFGAVTLPSGHLSGAPIVGDFDGDGDADMVGRHVDAGVFQGMRFIRNVGGGAYVDGGHAAGPGVSFSNSTAAFDPNSRALVADIDADGDDDVIVGNYLGFIAFRIWLSDGAGSFSMHQLAFGGRPKVVADLDSDGHPDLVTDSGIHFGAGDGTMLPRVVGPTIFLERDGMLGVGDLDGDGHPDIAHCRNSVNEVQVLWNNGDRTFTETNYPTPTPLSNSTSDILRVMLTDANADGSPDILVGPTFWYDGQSTMVLYGDGNRGFPSHTVQSFEIGPMFDADGDGDLDVLGPRVTRNAALLLPRDGMGRQYGYGTSGLGGVTPKFGAVGPFRTNNLLELRIVGVPGATVVVFVLGPSAADLSDWPLPGLHGFVNVTGAVPLVASGAAGQAGAGSISIPMPIVPGLAGIDVFHQAFVLDPSVVGGWTQTGGLELRYR